MDLELKFSVWLKVESRPNHKFMPRVLATRRCPGQGTAAGVARLQPEQQHQPTSEGGLNSVQRKRRGRMVICAATIVPAGALWSLDYYIYRSL